MREPHKRVLDAMVWLESGRIPMPWHRSLVAYAARFRPRTGSFKRETARLVEQHFITTSEAGLVLEHDGRLAAVFPGEDDAFTKTAYWTRMRRKLNPIERGITSALRSADAGVPVDELAEHVKASRSELCHWLAALVRCGTIESGRQPDGPLTYRRTGVLYPLSIFERRLLEPPAAPMDYSWHLPRHGRVQHARFRGRGSGLCGSDPVSWSTRPSNAPHCDACEALLAANASETGATIDDETPLS